MSNKKSPPLGQRSPSNISHGKSKKDQVKIPVDLTNPAEILKQMETLDLTEEETEDLLQKAYELNRKLKQHLHAQSLDVSQPHPLAVSAPSLGHRSKSMHSTAPLPPIKSKHTSPSGKSGHKTGASPVRSSPDLAKHGKQGRSTQGSASSSASSSRGKKPEWNDRFSYS